MWSNNMSLANPPWVLCVLFSSRYVCTCRSCSLLFARAGACQTWEPRARVPGLTPIPYVLASKLTPEEGTDDSSANSEIFNSSVPADFPALSTAVTEHWAKGKLESAAGSVKGGWISLLKKRGTPRLPCNWKNNCSYWFFSTYSWERIACYYP